MGVLMTVAATLPMLMQAPAQRASGEALAPGTVAVESADGEQGGAETSQLFAAAVQAALIDANFVTLPVAGHSRYIARFRVTQQVRGVGTARAITPSASGSVGGWGAQARVSLPTSKMQVQGLVVTRLSVELVLRRDMRSVWSGSATTAQVQGAPANMSPAVARKLADAAIRAFPVTWKEPVSVP